MYLVCEHANFSTEEAIQIMCISGRIETVWQRTKRPSNKEQNGKCAMYRSKYKTNSSRFIDNFIHSSFYIFVLESIQPKCMATA